MAERRLPGARLVSAGTLEEAACGMGVTRSPTRVQETRSGQSAWRYDLKLARVWHLHLINPLGAKIRVFFADGTRESRQRCHLPSSLEVLAGRTPKDWNVTIFDEDYGVPVYEQLRRPDLVGITGFSTQAARAYVIAACFRRRAVPVVMVGAHATMFRREASVFVDVVVTGSAESVCP